MAESHIDALILWLHSHGYESDHVVYTAALQMCDTVEDLLNLTDSDIDSAMSDIKIGVRRSLKVHISDANKTSTAFLCIPAPSAVPMIAISQSTATTAVATPIPAFRSSQVDQFLILCRGRVIFGRCDHDLVLDTYSIAMNSKAVELLEKDHSLVSFTGADVIRSVKIGPLLDRSRIALAESGYAFKKGSSRGNAEVSSSSNVPAAATGSSTSRFPTSTETSFRHRRVKASVREFERTVLPQKIKNNQQRIKDLQEQQNLASRARDFPLAISCGEKINDLLRQTTLLQVSLFQLKHDNTASNKNGTASG